MTTAELERPSPRSKARVQKSSANIHIRAPQQTKHLI